MDHGVVSFADLPNHGGRMTFSRGIRPSVAHILALPQEAFDRKIGTLEFNYGAKAIAFPNCAAASPVYHQRLGRHRHRWSLHVYDRRWKWRYPRINGTYNRRGPDGTVVGAGRKNLRELISLCLDALGETGYVVTAVPTDVYPPCIWNRAKAALELEWLCDLVGMEVVLGLDNVVRILAINQGSSDLPLLAVMSVTEQYWKSGLIPQEITIQGDPTIIQSRLKLEMVAPDTDGEIKWHAGLSYYPPDGWGWPEHFSAVNPEHRHLAFQYIYRWYRPYDGWNGDGTTIASHNQLELLDHVAESYEDEDGIQRPLPPVVLGRFWPYCDHPINTAQDTIYSGDFRVLTKIGVIEFAKPVFMWQNKMPEEPELDIICCYQVRNEDHDGYATYTKSTTVTESPTATSAMVLQHPELTKVKIIDTAYPLDDPGSDNLDDLDAEADRYLNQNKAIFSYTSSTEQTYTGLLDLRHDGLNLDGSITQIEWSCGLHQLAQTRVGLNTEFDLATIQRRQLRAMHRLSQMAERMIL